MARRPAPKADPTSCSAQAAPSCCAATTSWRTTTGTDTTPTGPCRRSVGVDTPRPSPGATAPTRSSSRAARRRASEPRGRVRAWLWTMASKSPAMTDLAWGIVTTPPPSSGWATRTGSHYATSELRFFAPVTPQTGAPMVDREFDLSDAMAEAVRHLQSAESLEVGLQRIAEAAARSIPGFTHAGISLLTRGVGKRPRPPPTIWCGTRPLAIRAEGRPVHRRDARQRRGCRPTHQPAAAMAQTMSRQPPRRACGRSWRSVSTSMIGARWAG